MQEVLDSLSVTMPARYSELAPKIGPLLTIQTVEMAKKLVRNQIELQRLRGLRGEAAAPERVGMSARPKSATDEYWSQRAATEADDAKVNMHDTVQRDHELQFVFRHLWSSARMIEIGCGNGYVTQQLRARVAHVDAFDYSENMVKRARSTYGEANNRFFLDNVLEPRKTKGPYDAALCVRVLINLRSLEDQKMAIRNISKMLRSGGRLILVEGFRDGFDAINGFRKTIGLSPAIPGARMYSYLSELLPTINEHFTVERRWHTGLYDFLTRVVFPQLVGAENATVPGEFHCKIEPIVRANDEPELARFARVHGFVLARQ
jgi:SAM-dependent methyltransferase